MRTLFIFFITLSLLTYLFQVGRSELKKNQLDSFYSEQFSILFNSRSPLEIEKLENYMFKDGYNWKEITTLKNQAFKKSVQQGDRSRFDLATLRLYLTPQELKPLLHPFYLDKLHKNFRNLLKDGYNEAEIKQLTDQALGTALAERYTDYETPVEISDESNWSFLTPTSF